MTAAQQGGYEPVAEALLAETVAARY